MVFLGIFIAGVPVWQRFSIVWTLPSRTTSVFQLHGLRRPWVALVWAWQALVQASWAVSAGWANFCACLLITHFHWLYVTAHSGFYTLAHWLYYMAQS